METIMIIAILVFIGLVELIYAIYKANYSEVPEREFDGTEDGVDERRNF